MPLLVISPVLALLAAQLFFPQHIILQSVPFPITSYAVMALVVILAGLMRQLEWFYWLALLGSHYWVIQTGLQSPLSQPDTAALYFFLPVALSASMILLSQLPKPPVMTPAGVILLLVTGLVPVSLLYLPLAGALASLHLPAVLLSYPFESLSVNWAQLWLIALTGCGWLGVMSFYHVKAAHWWQFSCWLSMMLFYIFIQRPDISGWVTLAALLSLLFTLAIQMLHLAYIDELTQLPQRRALMAHLKRLGRRSAVAMLDVDHFKKFNDTWGHDTGDQVLRLLGAVLADIKGYTAYRYGGEEFTLVFSHNNAGQLAEVLEQVRDRVASYPLVIRQSQRPKDETQGKEQRGKVPEKKVVNVTISLGCAIRQPGEKPEQLLKRADQALYDAKKAGRNRVELS
ncbi:GGDEF domain-containing protein [Chromatiaceae bacterium AAb-1]|nr:GGDEF domain-containing protein [Chromatiaceae bacterium AAb-1]